MSFDVQRLTQRLANAPPVFRASLGEPGAPDLRAVVADLFRDRARGGQPALGRLEPRLVEATDVRRRHLQLVLLAAWLLHDDAFADAEPGKLLALLDERLDELASTVAAAKFVEDGERREELVRTCIRALGGLPAGETETLAEDRLAALDSTKRLALLREAKKREAAREAERKKRAEELARLRAQEEEERRQAARTTHED